MKHLLKLLAQKADFVSDFRVAANFGCSCILVVCLIPFSANNFVQGRIQLGASSMAIVIVCGLNAWSIIRGRFRPLLTFLVIAPVVISTIALLVSKQGIIGVLWCFPAILAFYFMFTERQAWLANSALLIIILPREWFFREGSLASCSRGGRRTEP